MADETYTIRVEMELELTGFDVAIIVGFMKKHDIYIEGLRLERNV